MGTESRLSEGMVVYSSDGTKLGKITACRADGFIIEKGLFFPKSSLLHYDDVAELRNGDVFLRHTRDYLSDESSWLSRDEEARMRREGQASADERTVSSRSVEREGTTVLGEHASATRSVERELPTSLTERIASRLESKSVEREQPMVERDRDVLRVPLAEEEVSTEKHTRDIGEVRVHKRVVVKQKQISVPVMHEEVHIERISLDPGSVGPAADDAFVEKTLTIPLHEEDVEIQKHAVVREEVRLTKQALTDEFKTTTDVRSEEIDIEEPEALKRYRKAG